MIEGVKRFQEKPVSREDTTHRVIWRKANARLLDYGGEKDAPALLCVPSLINRHYIFDLYAKRSFVKFMRDQGVRVLVLDWDEPGVREQRYGLGEYVSYLLVEALDYAASTHRGPMHLLGYCMGGLLALAAAQLRPQLVDSLLLLATPWERLHSPTLSCDQWEKTEQFIMQQKALPPVISQTMFHLLDPWHFQEKFGRYTQMTQTEQAHFAQVERWANDGVPLSRYVARECYVQWPRDNLFAAEGWKVAGKRITPEEISCPSLCVTPTEDRIVPLHSSSPLVDLLPDVKRLKPDSGHISMMVGPKAKQMLWQPILKWIIV